MCTSSSLFFAQRFWKLFVISSTLSLFTPHRQDLPIQGSFFFVLYLYSFFPLLYVHSKDLIGKYISSWVFITCLFSAFFCLCWSAKKKKKVSPRKLNEEPLRRLSFSFFPPSVLEPTLKKRKKNLKKLEKDRFVITSLSSLEKQPISKVVRGARPIRGRV